VCICCESFWVLQRCSAGLRSSGKWRGISRSWELWSLADEGTTLPWKVGIRIPTEKGGQGRDRISSASWKWLCSPSKRFWKWYSCKFELYLQIVCCLVYENKNFWILALWQGDTAGILQLLSLKTGTHAISRTLILQCTHIVGCVQNTHRVYTVPLRCRLSTSSPVAVCVCTWTPC